MYINSFKDLKVWGKAHKLSLEVYKMTKTFPEDEKFGLISQVRRSAVSICANIVEGYMKSTSDFKRFLSIARGSLEETKYYLILSKDLFYLSDSDYVRLLGICDEIGKMIFSLSRRL